MRYSNERLKSKLLKKINKTKSGCWEWMGGRSVGGYGTLYDGQTTQKTHRLAYEVFVGPIPPQKLIMHSCDNPPCINPRHLEPGTNSQNIQSAHDKERYRKRKFFRDPSRHSHVKLNWRKVNKMRKLYAEGIYNYSELARKFKILPNTARAILTNQIWKYRTKEEWLEEHQDELFEDNE